MLLSEIKIHTLDGQPFDLATLQGQVVLIVNVASACGLTPQYAGLQSLYERYHDKGFTIIAVPCNQFGAQEPGTPAEIQTFCESKFKVGFPLTEKVEVNGENRHALYQHLIVDGADIEWNFAKFLLDKNGNTVARFHPKTEPLDAQIVDKIAELI